MACTSSDPISEMEEEEAIPTEESEPEETSQNLHWVQQGEKIWDVSVPVFGGSLDLSSSGNRLAVGSSKWNYGCSVFCKGLVRSYEFDGSSWVQYNDDMVGNYNLTTDFIGEEIALAADGQFLVVGSEPNPDSFNDYYTRVYENLNGEWVQIGSDILNQVGRGNRIAINESGTILVVSMPKNSGNDLVKIFRKNGNAWDQIGEDMSPGEYSVKVSLDAEGSLLAIGNSTGAGLIQFYSIGQDNWQPAGQISGTLDTDRLGSSMELSGDGKTLLLGGRIPTTDCTNCTGLAQPFHVVYENIGGVWQQKGQEISWLSDQEYYAQYEGVAAISRDGSRIALAYQKIRKSNVNEVEIFVHSFEFSASENAWMPLADVLTEEKPRTIWALDLNDPGDIIALGLNASYREARIFKLQEVVDQ
ncbi:hypothetical protein SAMN04490243_1572 [Robiginitalea myxolifaciens]|uniref:Uncharacterized protein n=1 Tax=Robiginitalea myxolifaciens TaxID=400055 RepID=A0A1I6GCH6_9FLAO|nr:hypothetical protein SAMN04490243_1572 [Robiginitalea myxolifaciens]